MKLLQFQSLNIRYLQPLSYQICLWARATSTGRSKADALSCFYTLLPRLVC
ncbi:unnamed protein product [Prunus brigantina]